MGCLTATPAAVVPQVYEVFLTSQHLAIAMEFGDAGSLLTYLQKQPGRRLPEATARWLFQQLVIGLSYTHHRVGAACCQPFRMTCCRLGSCRHHIGSAVHFVPWASPSPPLCKPRAPTPVLPSHHP